MCIGFDPTRSDLFFNLRSTGGGGGGPIVPPLATPVIPGTPYKNTYVKLSIPIIRHVRDKLT